MPRIQTDNFSSCHFIFIHRRIHFHSIYLREVKTVAFDLQNQLYNFWNRSFTRCAPEIERLFESVSRSCGAQKAMDDVMIPCGIPDNTR